MTHIRNRYFLVLDLIYIFCIPFLSLLLRVEFVYVSQFITQDLWIFLALAFVLKPFVFYYFGLYGRYWRFASVDDMLSIIWAVGVTTCLTYLWVLAEKHWNWVPGYGVPLSLPMLDGILTFLLVGGTRFSVRAIANMNGRSQGTVRRLNILIAGAGETGVLLYRSIIQSAESTIRPVGFLDDDPHKRNVTIGGGKVLGKLTDLPEVVAAYNVQEVILALPTASGTKIKEIFELCEKVDVSVKTVPSLNDIINGRVNVSALREVNIEDLLRREPVKIDNRKVADMLHGVRVMVTGAGGSIGSELCRQIADCSPEVLILLGHGENSLFNIHNELKNRNPELKTEVVVADLRDKIRLKNVFKNLNPEAVFHAAAHKHVPMMEVNVEEAVTNNVMGTRNLVEVAECSGVERFVTISSDKAVNPTNVMGTTKRITELIVRAAGCRQNKPYVSVRFGNVLGSRGSVVPFFKNQIAEGGPVTVTHPEMTRFFMTIPEATQLVLQAGTIGKPGNVFVLDMGKPVKILDLAYDLIELSGHKPGVDIEVKFTGLRPGEKMYEELFGGEEAPTRTVHKKIFMAPNTVIPDNLDKHLDELIKMAETGNADSVIEQLQKIVPEFSRLEVDK